MPLGSSSAAPVTSPGPSTRHMRRKPLVNPHFRFGCVAIMTLVRGGERAVGMSILGWIVLGLISGFIASKAVRGRGAGCLADIVLGLIGSVVGGWLFAYFGHHDPMRFNLV